MNVAAPQAAHADSALRTDRAAAISLTLTIALLALAAWPLSIRWRDTGDAAPITLHLVILAVALATLPRRAAVLRPVRDWLPLVVVPFLYVELRWIIPMIGAAHRDATVMAWERLLFPSNPS